MAHKEKRCGVLSSPAPPEMISISNSVFNTGCAVKHICNDNPIFFDHSSFTLLSILREHFCRVVKIALLCICKAARQFLVKLRLRHLIHVHRVRRLRQRNSERNPP